VVEFYDVPLKVGVVYEIAAMFIFNGVLEFLVEGDGGVAVPAPAGLFEVVDGTLPQTWTFAARTVGDDESGISAIWGYWSIVNVPDHLESLFDMKAPAMEAFLAELRSRVTL
jgi:hypothetical protein